MICSRDRDARRPRGPAARRASGSESGAGEVLIRVAAAGVNRPDVMQRQGPLPAAARRERLPGLEVAGVIESRRATASADWRVGDARVRAGLRAAATRRTASHRRRSACRSRAAGLGDRRGDPRDLLHRLDQCVRPRPACSAGETALFHGGASGIGTTAIQLAAARGVARLRDGRLRREVPRVRSSSAPSARSTTATEDFVEVVRRADRRSRRRSDPRHRRRAYVARNLAALAMDGRLVLIGFMEGEPTATVDFRRILGRRLTITGSTLRPRAVEEKGRDCRGAAARGLAAARARRGQADDLSDVSARARRPPRIG